MPRKVCIVRGCAKKQKHRQMCYGHYQSARRKGLFGEVASRTVEHAMSYVEIGLKMGVSDAMIYKIEKRAMEKLKAGLEARGFGIADLPDNPAVGFWEWGAE